MFVDYLTNSDFLKLLSKFLFCLMKALEWQSWLSGPKNLLAAMVSTQTFSSLWQILDAAEGRLLCLASWVSLRKSDQSTACCLGKSLFWCSSSPRLSLALLKILWISMVLVPNQSNGNGTHAGFLTNGSEQIVLNFFQENWKNMHLLSLHM